MKLNKTELPYLELLSVQYPSIQAASTDIINLSAILNLPKGTEHFLSDIHGEYEAFNHVLKNASGFIRRKIEEIFSDTLMDADKRNLATLIYYPSRKMRLILGGESQKNEWFRITLFRLVKMCRVMSSKYTRSKVRKALPSDFAYIIEELLHEQETEQNKQDYYNSIIATIIEIGQAEEFIKALAGLIQHLAIDRLHIIGDIYDRGPDAARIMDKLINYHSVDIQWGNHDILWMGAASGSYACIASAIRISLRYKQTDTLEDDYGISLLPLASFTMEVYKDDPCECFISKNSDDSHFTANESNLINKMHKAISIIQFKLEGQLIKRRPLFEMEDRLLLDKINYKNATINIDGKNYNLKDKNFPTIDPNDPYSLSVEETNVLKKLTLSFEHSERLQKHARFLFSRGSIYLVHNNNLLYHGCITMEKDKSFKKYNIKGKEYSGKNFLDLLERVVRQGYFEEKESSKRAYGQDTMWYLWSGAQSPLFGKDKMASFERYFIEDKQTHIENKDPYYSFREDEEVCRKILSEFGLNPDNSHILNGHVPVKVKKGESPVKAGGKLIVIDGGFSKAYQGVTGIAGYTLIYNSYGLLLSSHKPFQSTQKAIEEGVDMLSYSNILEENVKRIRVKDTDIGKKLQKKIINLQKLLLAYREGYILEKTYSD